MKDHPEYNEYATCYRCGFKKYCKLEGRNFVCYPARKEISMD